MPDNLPSLADLDKPEGGLPSLADLDSPTAPAAKLPSLNDLDKPQTYEPGSFAANTARGVDLWLRDGGPSAAVDTSKRFLKAGAEGIAGIPKVAAAGLGGVEQAVSHLPGFRPDPGQDTANRYGRVAQQLAPTEPGHPFRQYASDIAAAAAQGAQEQERTSVAEVLPLAMRGGSGEELFRAIPGASTVRDVAMSGLTAADPTGMGMAMQAGVPATMAAMRTDKLAPYASKNLRPEGEATYDQSSPEWLAQAKYLGQQGVREAMSPEAWDAAIQALMMGVPMALNRPQALPKVAAPVEPVSGGRLGSLMPKGPGVRVTGKEDKGSWGWQPLRQKLAGTKVGEYIVNADDVLRAKLTRDAAERNAMLEAAGEPPMPAEQIRSQVEAAVLARNQLRENVTLAHEQGAMTADRVNPMPERTGILPSTEAPKEAGLSSVQSRRLNQVLTSLPVQKLPANLEARLPKGLSQETWNPRYLAYRELYSRQIDAAIPNDAVLRETALDTLATQRTNEDLSGKDKRNWFTYKKTSAELAPINRAEAALRTDEANLAGPQGVENRAAALERKKFTDRALRNEQMTATQAAARAARASSAEARLAKMTSGARPEIPNAEGRGPVAMQDVAGKPLAQVRQALRERSVLSKDLRDARLADLRDSVPVTEQQKLVRPRRDETAALRPTETAPVNKIVNEKGATIFQGEEPGVVLRRTDQERLTAAMEQASPEAKRALSGGDPDTLFKETIAEKQRYSDVGDPEDTMMKIGRKSPGVISHAAEHGGDLLWRMTEKGARTNYGRAAVREKIRTVLRALGRNDDTGAPDPNRLGVEAEHPQNVKNNAEYYGKDVSEFSAEVDALLSEYAAAHAKLPVYNAPQRLARQVAIALGNKDWEGAVKNLLALRDKTEDAETWRKEAGTVEGAATEGEAVGEIAARFQKERTTEVVPGRSATLYLPEPGTASMRTPGLPPQPAPPSTRRVLTPEDIAATKLTPVQQESVKARLAQLNSIIVEAGLTKKELGLQARIASALRTLEQNKDLGPGQYDALRKVNEEARRIIAGEQSAATKAATKGTEFEGRGVGDAWLESQQILQEQYHPTGYQKLITPEGLNKTLLSQLRGNEPADIGLRGGGKAKTTYEKEGYKQRQNLGRQAVAYPGAGLAEAAKQNLQNYAADALEASLKDSPFAVTERNAKEAELLEAAGYQKIDNANSALHGKWVSPAMHEALWPKLDMTRPGGFLEANSEMTSWMARNVTAGRWSTAAMNGVSFNIANMMDLGLTPGEAARVWKLGLNAADHPQFGQDVRRLGGSSLVAETPRGAQALNLPEPSPSKWSKKNATPEQLADPDATFAKEYPSTKEAAGLYEDAASAKKSWLGKFLGGVDSVMDTQAQVLKAMGADTAALYSNPKRLAEAYRRMEVAGRQGTYLLLREKGMSHEAAAARVGQTQADYSNKSRLVRGLEKNLLGGLGGRFAHFGLAMSSRYADMLTNNDPVVMARAISIPAAFMAFNAMQDRAYVQAEADKGKSPEEKARRAKKAQEEIAQRDNLKPGFMKGMAGTFALNLGKDEKGNWRSLDLGRGMPHNPALQYANAGFQLGASDEALSRNALLGLLSFGLPTAPVVATIQNKDLFTGVPVIPTVDEKGTKAVSSFSPEGLFLMNEYLLSRYLPDQFPALGGQDWRASKADVMSRDKEDTSVRGAVGLQTSDEDLRSAAYSGLRPRSFSPKLAEKSAGESVAAMAGKGPMALVSRFGKTAGKRAAKENLKPRIKTISADKFPKKKEQ